MQLTDNNYPRVGTYDLIFETLDGELHKGCYDFAAYVIDTNDFRRRWFDEDKNEYNSGEVINWWISAKDISKCKECDNFERKIGGNKNE